MLLQIHDELVFEAPEAEIQELAGAGAARDDDGARLERPPHRRRRRGSQLARRRFDSRGVTNLNKLVLTVEQKEAVARAEALACQLFSRNEM